MKGIVASGHEQTTNAAFEILEAGGNAFDAAIAAGFAATVAEPTLASLGGGGFQLARTADGQAILFDFFVDTPGIGLNSKHLHPHFEVVTVVFPGSTQDFSVGYGSIAVPGALKGLLHIQQKLGCLPLKEVITPAIELARHGVLLNNNQSTILEMLHPIMTLLPGGKSIFEPKGKFLQEGDLYKNTDMADFVETLPKSGDREFYLGNLAQRISKDCAEKDGLITEKDLANYKVFEREPLEIKYRNCRLLTNPLPAFGGTILSYLLRLLEINSLEKISFGSLQHLSLISTIFEEAERYKTDNLNNGDRITGEISPGSYERIRTAFGGTTHINVYDGAGNIACMTMTNGEGSGYVLPGTGIMLNNMMGEDDLHLDGFHASPPGIRIASMMTPSILFENNQAQLIIGSGGSKRIKSAMLQVLSNFVDFDMSIRDAVEAPRIHWDGSLVQTEPGFTEGVIKDLCKKWNVNEWLVKDVYFGGVHAISTKGECIGDARRGGSARILA